MGSGPMSATAWGQYCVISARSGALTPGESVSCFKKNKISIGPTRNVRLRRCHRAISTSAVLSATTVSCTIAGSTLYCLPLFVTMICAPRWHVTRRLLSSDLVFLPLALTYCFLLSQSWEPDTLSLILPGSLLDGFAGGFNPQFFPKLEGIMSLFSRTVTAASLWVHLLAINLYAARSAYLQGLKETVPARHTVLLCALFAPLGLISVFVTHSLFRREDSNQSIKKIA